MHFTNCNIEKIIKLFILSILASELGELINTLTKLQYLSNPVLKTVTSDYKRLNEATEKYLKFAKFISFLYIRNLIINNLTLTLPFIF